MMPKDVETLLVWRWGTLPPERRNPSGLLQALTVEGLPYHQVPSNFREALTIYRHKAQAQRWSFVVQVCASQGPTPPDTMPRLRR